MSKYIEFDLKELRKLAKDKDSCVVEQNMTQNLALHPRCLGNVKGAIHAILNYKIGKNDNEMFNGILLSYKNLKIHNVGSVRNDNPEVYYMTKADYFIFRPRVGAKLKGIVNKKSDTHLGILVHRVFNIVIPNPVEDPNDKWIGASVMEGQEIVFRIAFVDLYRALPYIRGELDESWLNLDTDGNYEELETAQPRIVSHVYFHNTKPDVQKRTDDSHQLFSKDAQEENTTKSTSRKRKLKSSDRDDCDGNEPQSKEVSTPEAKGPAAKKRKRKSSHRSSDVQEIQMSLDETKTVEGDDTEARKENKSVRKRKSRKDD